MRFAGQVNLDNVQAFHRDYERVPSFGVKPFQSGLNLAFPKGTPEQFYKDLNNPIEQPQVEEYIYKRHIFDKHNPFPIT